MAKIPKIDNHQARVVGPEHLKTNKTAVMKAKVETGEWNMQANEYHQNML